MLLGLLPIMQATDCKNKYKCMEVEQTVVGWPQLHVGLVGVEVVELWQLLVLVFVRTFGEAELLCQLLQLMYPKDLVK